MITFTIVTCTYNAASVLQRTLHSVLMQEYEGVEHLIVDGASTDATREMAEEYKRITDARQCKGRTVKVVSEPDRGLYDAMNKALRMAAGDYLVFLNAGDSLPDRHTLEGIAAEAESAGMRPGVLYGDTDIVDAGGRFLRHRRLVPPEHLTWKSFRHGMLVCHQAFYVRTDVARRNPYNLNYRYSADVDWCIRVMKDCAASGLSLLNLHRVVAYYLDGGMSVANHRASLRERFKVMRSHYGLATTVAMHLWFFVRAAIRR